jgi:hypothetical protein
MSGVFFNGPVDLNPGHSGDVTRKSPIFLISYFSNILDRVGFEPHDQVEISPTTFYDFLIKFFSRNFELLENLFAFIVVEGII